MREIAYIVTVPRERFEPLRAEYDLDRALFETIAGVPCRMLHYDELPSSGLPADTPRILSGGKAGPGFPLEEVFYDEGFRRLILHPAAPTLAICRSFQLASVLFGAEVRAMPRRPGLLAKDGGWYEEGPRNVHLTREDPLFAGLPPLLTVHQNHRNEVRSIPAGFLSLASGETCPIQAWRHPQLPLYGMQFHPERGGHPHGHTLLRNFFHF